MDKFDLELELERSVPIFRPGERIRGTARAAFYEDVVGSEGLTLKLCWRTSGRGDVEQGAAESDLLSPGSFAAGERVECAFDFPCPEGPFSAEQEYVTVEWNLELCVDVSWVYNPVKRFPLQVVAGPCREPFLGKEAGELLRERPGFLSTPGEAKGFVGLGVVGGLGLAGLFFAGVAGHGPLLAATGTALAGSVAGAVGLYAVQRVKRARVRGLEIPLPARRELETGTHPELSLVFTAASDLVVRSVDAGWRLHERAVDTSGTSRQVFTREALRTLEPVLGEPLEAHAGDEVSVPLQLEVPTVPSFRGEKNQLDWAVLVRLGLMDGTELLYQAPVLVLPPRSR